jgi:hypothetical protein
MHKGLFVGSSLSSKISNEGTSASDRQLGNDEYRRTRQARYLTVHPSAITVILLLWMYQRATRFSLIYAISGSPSAIFCWVGHSHNLSRRGAISAAGYMATSGAWYD